IAFYERASPGARASMRKAVEDACATHRATAGNGKANGAAKDSSAAWLCSGAPLAFFRAVGVGGKRGTGLICSAEGLEHFMYLPSRLMGYDLKCVSVDYHFEEPHYGIDPNELT